MIHLALLLVFLNTLVSGNTIVRSQGLAVILSGCDQNAAISPDALKLVLQKEVSVLFQKCSYQQFEIDFDVYPDIVPIDCQGSCDYLAWTQQALLYINNSDLMKKNRHHIFILPKVPSCAFSGLGDVGCGSGVCNVWIHGDVSEKAGVYLHEISHNLGLNHASTETDEYGDLSDIMGYCCSQRCYNAPHSEMLSWTTPFLTLDMRDWQVPVTFNISLAYSMCCKKSYIKIITSFFNFYIQYKKQSNIEQFDSGWGNSVYVYRSPRFDMPTKISYESTPKTTVVATLNDITPAGVMYTVDGNIYVQIIDFSGEMAYLMLSRSLTRYG